MQKKEAIRLLFLSKPCHLPSTPIKVRVIHFTLELSVVICSRILASLFAVKDEGDQMTNRYFLKLILAISLVFSPTVSFSQASSADRPVVAINPELIKSQLLDANVNVLLSLNKVQKAKEQVNISRGNLLPSINLGFLLSGDPSFLLSSVSVLLPFLLPSNWIILKQNKQLLAAEGKAYYIAQLNAYASGLALYQTYLADREIRNVVAEQLRNNRLIEEETKRRFESGKADLSELLQAQAQSKNSLLQLSQLNVLLGKEASALREMLALPLEAELVFEDYHPNEMAEEAMNLSQLAQKAIEVSPEKVQMQHLIEAAKLDKWAKAFSFITGSSLNGQSRGDVSASFSDLTHTGSVGLGFGYFPALELSSLNIEAMRLRDRELELENAHIAEDLYLEVNESKKQVVYAVEAEIKMQQVYDSERIKFENGWTDLLRLYQLKSAAINAKVARIKATMQLDQARYGLQRTLIVGQFGNIKDCNISKAVSGNKAKWWEKIFKRNRKNPTIEEACRL